MSGVRVSSRSFNPKERKSCSFYSSQLKGEEQSMLVTERDFLSSRNFPLYSEDYSWEAPEGLYLAGTRVVP